MACTTDDAGVWSPEGPTALSDLSIRLSSMLDKLEEEREAVKFSDAERFAEVALPQSDNVHKRPHTEISGTCSALRDVVLIRDKVGNSESFSPPEKKTTVERCMERRTEERTFEPGVRLKSKC